MKNTQVLLWSITVAMGGFLFGFDTAVISGAEQQIQEIWNLNTWLHGLTVSIALVGTVFGALFGGYPADSMGRKKVLFWIGVLYFVSAIGSAISTDWYLFMFFRFIGGLGVGASSVVAPMYISEIAPAKSRGRLVAMFQFNIVFGIVISYFSNYVIGTIGGADAWRWMLGIEGLPAIIYTLLVLGVPESPRWLIAKKGDYTTARAILGKVDEETADEDLQSLRNYFSHHSSVGQKIRLFTLGYRFPIILAVLFAAFNQLAGINGIIYYAPRIFEWTGLGKDAALLSTVGIGLTNMAFTLLALTVIDKFGRKSLMYVGSVGLILTLSLVALAFFTNNFHGFAVPIYIYCYIGFFAFSQGAVIWVFISEIFPNEVRAQGQALGSFTHWILAALVSFIFPALANPTGTDIPEAERGIFGPGPVFLFFAFMMVLQLIFVWRLMPETKGKSLENLGDQMFTGKS